MIEIYVPPVVAIREYVAIMNQAGTATDPTVVVLHNTLGGEVTWIRNGAGVYVGEVENEAFIAGRTVFILGLDLINQQDDMVFAGEVTGAHDVTLNRPYGDGLTNAMITIKVYAKIKDNV